jgi:hypothetical protein
MALTPSSVTRSTDVTGDEILTLQTPTNQQVQAIAVVDDTGAQAGIPANPLSVQGETLTAIQDAIVALSTLVNALIDQRVTDRANIQSPSSTGLPFAQNPGTLELWNQDTNLMNVLGSSSLVSSAKKDNRLKVESVSPDAPALFDFLSIANDSFTYDVSGRAMASVQISGVWVGTISFEATLDLTNWVAIPGMSLLSTSAPVASTTTIGIFRFNCMGVQQIRIRMTAYTSGVATVTMIASTNPTGQFFNQDSSYRMVTYDATLPTTLGAVSLIAPINRVLPIAPLAFATQTTYTDQKFSGVPYIQPRLRVEAAGSQQLPFAQRESTYELMVQNLPLYRIMEDLLFQSMISNNLELVNLDSRQGSNSQRSGMSGYTFLEVR